MAENAYLTRLKQLRDKKVEDNERKVQPFLNKPLTRQAPGPGIGPGPSQPMEQEEPAPDMNSLFGKNFESFQGEDKRFGEFFNEYRQLAEGLSQEVKQGFMPMPIAEQRLKSYLSDSAKYFQQNKATPLDNPQIDQLLEGMLSKAMQGQGQAPEQGAPAQPTMPQEGM